MRRAIWSVAVAASALSLAARAEEPKDEVRKVAEAYLDALTGKGSEEGRKLLLGGATANAQLFNLENWKVVGRAPPQFEQGDLGKDIYWHPKNPVRELLAKSGGTGRYSLALHLFTIETREGPRRVPRQWPLRVLHFRAGSTDTGWKILPASDWNAE